MYQKMNTFDLKVFKLWTLTVQKMNTFIVQIMTALEKETLHHDINAPDNFPWNLSSIRESE